MKASKVKADYYKEAAIFLNLGAKTSYNHYLAFLTRGLVDRSI
jgi:hypothetical protein